MGKYKVNIAPNSDGEIPSDEWLLDEAEKAGWSDDPTTGKAILALDERGAPGYEILNPIPVAPPVGFEPTPPLDELIRQRVKEEVLRLEGEDEIDDIVDAEDFDVPDELPELSTIYEFISMEDQVPALRPAEPDVNDRAKADAEYAELVERHRANAKRRSREEYDKRVKEAEALYGPPESVREALKRGEEREP